MNNLTDKNRPDIFQQVFRVDEGQIRSHACGRRTFRSRHADWAAWNGAGDHFGSPGGKRYRPAVSREPRAAQEVSWSRLRWHQTPRRASGSAGQRPAAKRTWQSADRSLTRLPDRNDRVQLRIRAAASCGVSVPDAARILPLERARRTGRASESYRPPVDRSLLET